MTKRGENRSITNLGDVHQEKEKRELICKNCNYLWKSDKPPTSFSKCPNCEVDNNPSIRRTIFYKGLRGRMEF